MSIVSSIIESDLVQADGRRWVHELHTDNLGKIWERCYLVDALYDALAALSTYAVQLAEHIKQAEINSNIRKIVTLGYLAQTNLDYSTTTENFAALRSYYKSATEVEAIMAGDFLNARTDTQLKSLFNYTQAQVDSLRTNKLTPAAQSAAAIRAASGE